MNVKLEAWKTGPYLVAPDHCPFKFWDSYGEGLNYRGEQVVHSSFCSLCKLCSFTAAILKPELDIKVNEFVNYLTLLNTKVSVLINNQNYFLRQKDRIPLAILISPEIFDSMLNVVYKDDSVLLLQVKAHFVNNESPLCHILGCPVYFSRKLTKSDVMVVGEIEWK